MQPSMNIQIIDDNASFASSSSDDYNSWNEHLPHGWWWKRRRCRTFQRLSQWISKRTSDVLCLRDEKGASQRQGRENFGVHDTIDRHSRDEVSTSYAACCDQFTATGAKSQSNHSFSTFLFPESGQQLVGTRECRRPETTNQSEHQGPDADLSNVKNDSRSDMVRPATDSGACAESLQS